jgi:8-oxo-dGTP pyrophosphatase MutT (NUDIX family)
MDETNRHLIQVVAGINVKHIDNVPYVLLGLKPHGNWEFPGGKIEYKESHSQAMEREWMEELGVNISMEEKRFGHARNGVYDIWFYEVEVDEQDNEEPTAKEHVEVEYFNIDDLKSGVIKLNMNKTNRVIMSKVLNKYK